MTQENPENVNQSDPRVGFAAERTFLAWIRTGLAMMGFGFVVARFGLFLREMSTVQPVRLQHSGLFSFWAGTGLILLGVFVFVASTFQHVQTIRRLRSGKVWELRASVLGITVTAILVAVGVSLATYLIMTRP